MRKRVLGSVVFAVAFVLNPAFLMSGCGPQFSEADAVAVVAVAGAHRTYAFTQGDAAYEVVVDITQSKKVVAIRESFVTSASACGDRTFVKSASACMDITKVPVTGTITIQRTNGNRETVVDHAPVDGLLEEFGMTLGDSSLTLQSPSGRVALGSKDARTFSLTSVTWSPAGATASSLDWQGKVGR